MSSLPGQIHRFVAHIERTVSESEQNSTATLNDLSLNNLEEVKVVLARGGRDCACEYLRFLVAMQRPGDAEDFCEEVLEGGADVATWGISDRLAGILEQDHEGLGLTVNEYIAILDGISGERWFRLRPVDSTIRPLDEFPGSSVGPGTLIRAARYWTPMEALGDKPIVRLAIDPQYGIVETIPDSTVDVAIRRWMATLAAWWSRDYLMAEGSRATVEGIIAAYPSPIVPSPDGMIALRALVREAGLNDPRWPREVGFIGPDEWYRP